MIRQKIYNIFDKSFDDLLSAMNFCDRSLYIASIVLLSSVAGLAGKAPPSLPFQKFEECSFKDYKWNDGDSFHVILPDQKELIFRVYFVDCPESENSFPDRVAEQAAYFGITPEQALAVGKQAAAFTKAALSKPFTVQTRWRNALGRSTLPRYYAIITTADGKDLNELLVSAGLARIYGTRTPPPDGGDSRAYLAHLAELESHAKKAGLGGWRKAE